MIPWPFPKIYIFWVTVVLNEQALCV